MEHHPSATMNCDRLAPFYEFLERISFGRSLERCRGAFLDHTKASQRAIICGGGDGRFLTQLLSVNPAVEVDFVDLSPKMVELAEIRLSSSDRKARKRVRFFVADIRGFQPRHEGYDLIATHFFLDCFTDAELISVIRRIAAWATPNAQWLVSEFRYAQEPYRRAWTHAVISSLYAAFRFTTGLQVRHLPDYSAGLARSGFALRFEVISLYGLLYSAIWVAVPSRVRRSLT